MFSPSEILEKQFKSGLGYDKKDVESYLQEISTDFSVLLQENDDLKRKLKEANEGLAYYKSIEKTLQKALVLAEKTAHDTKNTALKEAEVLEKEAKTKASQIISEAYKKLQVYEHKMLNLIQQYDFYKIQFENLLKSQQELLNSKSFSINTDDFMLQDVAGVDLHQVNMQDNYKNLTAVTNESEEALHSEVDISQFQFDFLKESAGNQSEHTDDGFEFFTMKDE